MERTMQQAEGSAACNGLDRRRAADQAMLIAGERVETPAEVAHEARNMATALELFCDLLEEPGVLAAPYAHYGNDLRLVASTCHRLIEKLVTINFRRNTEKNLCEGILYGREGLSGEAAATGRKNGKWASMPPKPVESLAAELMASRNLLAALAGPAIGLTVEVEGGAKAVWLSNEDLTRVLVNLVKNAAEAMPSGGRIAIRLREYQAGAVSSSGELQPWLLLTVEDDGPGIPTEVLDKIFESGYTTHSKNDSSSEDWSSAHRGLGLPIIRSILEAAGGRIHAANRNRPGACFEIALPVRSR
jgi:signal transduction histidine kinase